MMDQEKLPDGTPCETDHDPTTYNERCMDGVCVGSSKCDGVVCKAKDQCHAVGTCNPTTGICSDPNMPESTPCDDGDPTTEGQDKCVRGQCMPEDTCADIDEKDSMAITGDNSHRWTCPGLRALLVEQHKLYRRAMACGWKCAVPLSREAERAKHCKPWKKSQDSGLGGGAGGRRLVHYSGNDQTAYVPAPTAQKRPAAAVLGVFAIVRDGFGTTDGHGDSHTPVSCGWIFVVVMWNGSQVLLP